MMGEPQDLYTNEEREEMRRELYDRDGIVIDVNRRDPNSHDVWLGPRGEGNYFMLPRGVLREAATSPVSHVRQMMSALGSGMHDVQLRERGISYETFALACAQARIKELDLEVEYHIQNSARMHTL